jgi:RNA:NAD 2'-phosphotransferase (TPT1/KptA family)
MGIVKDVREHINQVSEKSTKKVIELYHGTTAKIAEKILKAGLSKGYVDVEKDGAVEYASGLREDSVAVVTINIPRVELATFVDTDWLDDPGYTGLLKKVPTKYIIMIEFFEELFHSRTGKHTYASKRIVKNK